MDRNVISFAFTLKNKAGDLLDQAPTDRPVMYLEGSEAIIPGLERGLAEMDQGQKDRIMVRPEDGYGFRDEANIDIVSKSKLPVDDIKIGDYFRAGSDNQAPVVKVVKIEGDNITLDANHPLAGQDLVFDVELVEKRAATENEIAHGHAHAHHEGEEGGCCGGGGGGCGCSH
ncbi:MAG: FKBP-type peptidyl-prolyl cis-trans isomerase [Verrucomicrobiota bacterium]